MSTRRAERLVNLVICLLATRQYLPANRIRQAVPGYGVDDDGPAAAEAFKRMFERDKAELRELGVPLETGRNSVFDNEDGYRIARPAYELPEINFGPDEAAAVGLATRLWQSARLAEAARGALLKLRAGGIEVDPGATMALEPRVDATEPAFPRCLEAVKTRRAIAFDYRAAGRQETERRDVEPWGVVSWHGRWYLVAHDRDRGAARCFRLSRITGPVTPPGPTVRSPFPRASTSRRTSPTRRRSAATPRGCDRRGPPRVARPGPVSAEPAPTARTDDGAAFDLIEVEYGDPESLADRVAGYGSAVVVLEPPDVRDAVRPAPHHARRNGGAGRRLTPPGQWTGCPGCSRSFRICWPTRVSRWPRPPTTSVSPRNSCAPTSNCSGCAACPGTARAT